MKTRSVSLIAISALIAVSSVIARQNQAGNVRPIPPPGIEVSAPDRAELEAGIAELGKEIEGLQAELKSKPEFMELVPDVQIYFNAVRYALKHNEFFKPEEIRLAKEQLKQGFARARGLREGKPAWTQAPGLVVRGYVSEIDGSVQPYGLVVPDSYRPGTPYEHRLDVWFHGRGETLSEVNFINDRQKYAGQFAPPNTFVLHPYGRYCNANKFAGEIDLFESLAAVRKAYPIDENRISVRGFSMGGAATWHIAAHHAGLWAAAAPGAGFAETAEYLKLTPNETPWYERKLWHWYDATDYAVNLFNCPLVAYSGELDRQKQAADIMAREMLREGMELIHIIGPQTEHKYHPDAIKEINRRLDGIVAKGRNPLPRQVKFTTWTLRYDKMFWVTVDWLEQHWERARVDAEIKDLSTVIVKTGNVYGLTLDMPAGLCPLDPSRKPAVLIDGQKLAAPAVQSDRSWTVHFRKFGQRWMVVADTEPNVLTDPVIIPANSAPLRAAPPANPPIRISQVGSTMTILRPPREVVLRKRHGLQGPIDDAFMSSFVFVRPTGKPLNQSVGDWVNGEQARAFDQWRKLFRGEARVKDDAAIDDQDIARHNLILWGDPASNRILAKIIDRLPVVWDMEKIKIGEQIYSAGRHVPILIYPNPLNPRRYVVINSGFTFREADHLSNARQTPKLPDWAVVDLSVPPGPHAPGRITNAGFFDERWELLPAQRRN